MSSVQEKLILLLARPRTPNRTVSLHQLHGRKFHAGGPQLQSPYVHETCQHTSRLTDRSYHSCVGHRQLRSLHSRGIASGLLPVCPPTDQRRVTASEWAARSCTRNTRTHPAGSLLRASHYVCILPPQPGTGRDQRTSTPLLSRQSRNACFEATRVHGSCYAD